MIEPYFERGNVALFHGDARELLPALGLRSDLVLTDVPYAPKTHAGARTLAGGKGGRALIGFEHFDEPTLLAFFDAVGRVADRWVVSTVDVAHAHVLAESPPASLRFVRRGVWVKTNPAPQLTGDRPGQGFEDLVVLHAQHGRLVWNGGGLPLTLRVPEQRAAWRDGCGRHDGDVDFGCTSCCRVLFAALHDHDLGTPGAIELPGVRKSNYSTEKPIALGRQLVKLFSFPGAVVLDPACGSGAFLRAALQLGRIAIGIDVDERALEVAARLIEQPPKTDAATSDELRELPVRRRSLLHECAGLPVEVEPSY